MKYGLGFCLSVAAVALLVAGASFWAGWAAGQSDAAQMAYQAPRGLFGSVAKEAGSDAAATIAAALDRLSTKVDDSEIVIQVRRKQ